MQGIYPQLQELGVEVLAVNFSKPERLPAFVKAHPFPFPVVSDPDFKAYRAFELTRTNWLTFFRPDVMWRYFRLMLRGWVPKANKEDDMLQLGGDFILDRERRLVYAYRSKEPTDRPTVDALLQAVRSALAITS